MKRYNSHQQTLENNINSLTIHSISEKLITISSEKTLEEANQMMKNKSFDLLGVEDAKKGIVGYIEDNSKSNGFVNEHAQIFKIEELVSKEAPLKETITRLVEMKHLFILGAKGVESIVTTADLRKPPVNMFIFGSLMLFESVLAGWIRKNVSMDSINNFLSEKRVEKAKNEFDNLLKENNQIDLIDCFQLCDKFDILIKNREKSIYKSFSKKQLGIEKNSFLGLRNFVCHVGDHSKNYQNWEEILSIINKALGDTKKIIESM
jgi:hypothetical protein